MVRAVDSPSAHGLPPVPYNKPAAAVYFVCVVMVLNVLFMNLVISVLVARFRELKKEFDGSALMTASQQQWANATRLLHTVQLTSSVKQPSGCFRKFLFRLCTHTEHAHGPAYETSLTAEFRLQLAHFILAQVLAAQRCESIPVVAGERRQVMERPQHTFRRHGRS